MKSFVLTTTVICLFVFSCEKKDDRPAPEAASSTTSTTTGGTTAGSTGSPTNATVFHGAFTSNRYSNNLQGTDPSHYNAGAFFSDPPVEFMPDSLSGVKVEEVRLTGTMIDYVGYGLYGGIITAEDAQTDIWKVRGANGMPSFTVQNNIGIPSGAELSVLPVQIDKSAGLTFSLNLQNLRSGSLTLDNGSTPSTVELIVELKQGVQTFSFTPSQLAGLKSGTKASLSIGLENFQVLNIQGKNFKFNKLSGTLAEIPIVE